jgi:hypothetical protein
LPNGTMLKEDVTFFEKCKQKIKAQWSVSLHMTHISIDMTIVL